MPARWNPLEEKETGVDGRKNLDIKEIGWEVVAEDRLS